MNFPHYFKTVFLFIVFAAFVGCSSKEDKPAETSAPAQDKATGMPAPGQEQPGAKPVSAPDTAAAPAVTPQDMVDARAVAARVHSQMKSGNFSAIYKEAAPTFKGIGSESQFVSYMQQTRQKTGAIKSIKETGFATSPGKKPMLYFAVQYEKVKSDQRLTFARAQGGKMELYGFDQKDAK